MSAHPIDDARKHGIPMPPGGDRSNKSKPPSRPESVRITPNQRLEQLAEEKDDSVSTQNLLSVARGVGLILDGLHDVLSEQRKLDLVSVSAGLVDALFMAADRVDLEMFQSPGELVRTLDPEMKGALLRRELHKLRKTRERTR